MKIKACTKCGAAKPLYQFYAHPKASDGFMGKCKECTKEDVRANRRKKLDYYHTYDRVRFQEPERRRMHFESCKRQRVKYPDKYKARTALNNALRDGRISRLPCSVCGDPISEAHHADYSKPLDVTWFCFQHHRKHEGRLVA